MELKGLCRQNVNNEYRQPETCIQISSYVGLKRMISFFIQITLMIVSGMVTSGDKDLVLKVIQKLL